MDFTDLFAQIISALLLFNEILVTLLFPLLITTIFFVIRLGLGGFIFSGLDYLAGIASIDIGIAIGTLSEVVMKFPMIPKAILVEILLLKFFVTLILYVIFLKLFEDKVLIYNCSVLSKSSTPVIPIYYLISSWVTAIALITFTLFILIHGG